jgi:hypothetical protein
MSTKKIISFLIILCVGFSFNTYVTKNFLHFGDFGAEGLPTILGIIIWLYIIIKSVKNDKLNIDLSMLIYSSYLVYLFSITALITVFLDQSLLKFIFFYQYLPVISLLLVNKFNEEIDFNFILYWICIFSALSALFGILQFFGLNGVVPIDINRARGLSRSTLNFSSLMFLGFIAACNLRNIKARNLFALLIFIGVLVSQSRGAIVAVAIFTLINFYNNKKFYQIMLAYLTILIILSIIIQFNFDLIGYMRNNNSFNELIYRLTNIASVSTDDNSLRVARYLQFFKSFNPFGSGVGSTGPGANRFEEGIHFESFLLNILFQGGMIAILFWPIFILNLYIKFKPLLQGFVALILSYLSMMALQQNCETPSVNVMAWILIFLLILKSRITNKNAFVNSVN